MTTWNDGYVSDVAYTEGFYRQQMPAHLDAVCLVAGVEPPVERGAPFTYCELGCGLGHTAMAVAAANRGAQVWGFDFNPSHIAHASAVAARSGLDNVRFAERSFEELAEAPSADLPAFDYVTLHGVWSWVSGAARAHVAAFLRRVLRPGGLVYVSYNAMPGWTNALGLQHLLFEAGRATGGGSDRRVREAVALARRVADAGGSAVDQAYLERLERMLEAGQVSYAVHEYMHEHWRPAFFADVAAALATAKLDYVGSANILENFPNFCMRTDEQIALVEGLPPGQRETVLDYFCPRAFRRDLFVRGPRHVPPLALRGRLDAQRLALTVPERVASFEVEIPVGKATLGRAFYGPALATLADRTATVGDLRQGSAPVTAPVAEEILGMLLGGEQAMPAPGAADPEAVARARRYNRERVALAAETAKQVSWIVGTVIASAIRIGLDEMLVYEAVASRAETGAGASADAVFADVVALLKARGMKTRSDEPDGEQGLATAVRAILAEQVPIWRRLGAL